MDSDDETRLAMLSGHVGPYDVFTLWDVVTVTDKKKIVSKRRVPGLSAFLAEEGRVRLTLGHTEDFTILGLWGPSGFGYALNLDDPELSEWGYGGGG